MMADLATCEWSPGSHRSMVNPVVAVARLDMPAAMRAVLVEKIKAHKFDDVVSIGWATIASNDGRAQYLGVISNMNFAEGRLCHAVTRNKWALDRTEGAIVYTVGDRSFGYASACGNLFELEQARPVANRPAVTGLDYGGAEPVVTRAEVESLFAPVDITPESGSPFSAEPLTFAVPAITAITYQSVTPITPVPEPKAWALIVAGLAAIAWRKKA